MGAKAGTHAADAKYPAGPAGVWEKQIVCVLWVCGVGTGRGYQGWMRQRAG